MKAIRLWIWLTIALLIASAPAAAKYDPPIRPADGSGPVTEKEFWLNQEVTDNYYADLLFGFDGDKKVRLWEAGLSTFLLFLFAAGLWLKGGVLVGRIAWLGRTAQRFPNLFRAGKFLLRAEPARIYTLGRLESYESRKGRGMGLERYTYGILNQKKTLTERFTGLGNWILDDVMFYTFPKFFIGGGKNFLIELGMIFTRKGGAGITSRLWSAGRGIASYFRTLRKPGWAGVASFWKNWTKQYPRLTTQIWMLIDDLRTTIRQGRIWEFLIGANGEGRGFLTYITRLGNITAVFNMFVLTLNQQLKYGIFPRFNNYYETFRDSWRIGTALGFGMQAVSPWIKWIAKLPGVRSIAGLQIKKLYPAIAGEYTTLAVIGDVVVEEEIRSKLDPTMVARRQAGLSAKKSLLSGTMDALTFRSNVNPVFFGLMDAIGIDDAQFFYEIVGGDLGFMQESDVSSIKKLLSMGLSMEEIAHFYRKSGKSTGSLGDAGLKTVYYLVKGVGAENAGLFYANTANGIPAITNSDVSLMKALSDKGVPIKDVALFYSKTGSGLETAVRVDVGALSEAIKTLGPGNAAILYTTAGSLPIKAADVSAVRLLMNEGVAMEDIASFYRFAGISLGEVSGDQAKVMAEAINAFGPLGSSALYRINGPRIPMKRGDIAIVLGMLAEGVEMNTIALLYRDTGRSLSDLDPGLVPVFSYAVKELGPTEAVHVFESLGYDPSIAMEDIDVMIGLRRQGVSLEDVSAFYASYGEGLSKLSPASQGVLAHAINTLGPENAAKLFSQTGGAFYVTVEDIKLAASLMGMGVPPGDLTSFYMAYREAAANPASISSLGNPENLADLITVNGSEVAASAMASFGGECLVNYRNYSGTLSTMTESLGQENAAQFIRYGGRDAVQAYRSSPEHVEMMLRALGPRQAGLIYNS